MAVWKIHASAFVATLQSGRLFNKAQRIFMFATTFDKDKVKFKKNSKMQFFATEMLRFAEQKTTFLRESLEHFSTVARL